ncbi:MAG: prepilin-type N-terminal cleavage/methylation domain-containing protein [candidate division NC10 bacterium]|nr:prepilin-type N-terminal cleavage/methylation domain-containing protein [candidate division NC10 bacterium]
MGTGFDHRGIGLIEVVIAAAILAVGLLAVMGTFPTSYGDVVGSGGQSKATAYGQQKLEQLKNQPFSPGPVTASDSLESGEFTRTWTIAPVAGTSAPNRLARIIVTVNWAGRGGPPKIVTLETMRAE